MCCRQSDVWTLLAAAVKHSPAGQQAQLGQAVRRDLAESDRIIQVKQVVVTWDKTFLFLGPSAEVAVKLSIFMLKK